MIEDIVPLHDLTVTFAVEHRPRRVYLVPSMQPADYVEEDGQVTVKLAKLDMHVGVVYEY